MTSSTVELTSPLWTATADQNFYFWSSLGLAIPPTALQLPFDYSSVPGQWAIIDLRNDAPVLIADLPRSHTLLYSYEPETDQWIISDDPARFASSTTSKEDAELFPHLGYTLGPSTLLAKVNAVEAFSSVELLTDGATQITSVFEYVRTADLIADPEKFSSLFSEALDSAIERVISEAAGATLVIPLSGGLDSRLMALWLKKFNYPNVITFSYGKPGIPEAKISNTIADKFGFPWFFVPYSTDKIRTEIANGEAAAFASYCWSGTSLPHIQDFFALKELKASGAIPDDAIFLPGHTIVGNMHDVETLLSGGVSETEVVAAISKHHAGLLGYPRRIRKKDKLSLAINERLKKSRFNGDAITTQTTVESFNIAERQAKYINNSMRGYEFFGWRWALPMLDAQICALWLKGSPELTSDRRWYKQFIDNNMLAISDQKVSVYAPKASKLPPRSKQLLLSLLKRTGGELLLRRWRSVQTMLDHPLAFEAFNPSRSSFKQFVRMMTGASSVGLWSESFIVDGWLNQEFPPK